MDNIDKIKKYWEILKKQEGYSNDKVETGEIIIEILELIKTASKNQKSEESKIIKRIIESIFYSLLNIDVSVVKAHDLDEDKVVSCDEPSIYKNSYVNSSYLEAISKHIPQLSAFYNTGNQVLDAILQKGELRENGLKKIEINFEWLNYIFGKYFQNENLMTFQISEHYFVNILLGIKVYITQEFFPQLMNLFKITNNLGTENIIVLTKYLIEKHQEALLKNKQVSILSTFIYKNKSIEICKKTSNKYSKAILNVLQSKLYYIQGIKVDKKQNRNLKDIPQHKNVKVVKKTIDNYLRYLTEEHNGELIMSNEEYEILKEHTVSLIINNTVPHISTKFRKINVSNLTIIYSYYQIHNEFFDNQNIRDTFINFLKAYFSQLKNYEKSTIKTKFSVRPKRFPY